jgi:hypothetical protein
MEAVPSLSSLNWTTILSGVGVAYIASWVLFLLMTPILQKVIQNWKIATLVSYGLSWVAMFFFFKFFAAYASTTTLSAPSTPSILSNP